MDLDALSEDPTRRLQQYRESRAGYERELVAGLFRQSGPSGKRHVHNMRPSRSLHP